MVVIIRPISPVVSAAIEVDADISHRFYGAYYFEHRKIDTARAP